MLKVKITSEFYAIYFSMPRYRVMFGQFARVLMKYWSSLGQNTDKMVILGREQNILNTEHNSHRHNT